MIFPDFQLSYFLADLKGSVVEQLLQLSSNCVNRLVLLFPLGKGHLHKRGSEHALHVSLFCPRGAPAESGGKWGRSPRVCAGLLQISQCLSDWSLVVSAGLQGYMQISQGLCWSPSVSAGLCKNSLDLGSQLPLYSERVDGNLPRDKLTKHCRHCSLSTTRILGCTNRATHSTNTVDRPPIRQPPRHIHTICS